MSRPANAQTSVTDTVLPAMRLELDDVVVKAVRGGWDVSAFIRRMQNDTTFFKAFRSLRMVPYSATNSIRILDGKGGTTASLQSRTKQKRSSGCRTMEVLEEKTTGDFYKRDGDYNYYTAELYAYLFFTKGKICTDNDIVAGALDDRGRGGLERSKWQLKQLIFNPGSKVRGVPLMGDRAAIFEPEEQHKYNFRLTSELHEGQDCYVFRALPKTEYRNTVVYNELSTWFRKSDYSIVARNYSLSYHTAVYDFDVAMKVRLTTAHGKLLPARIEYNGNWHALTKGRERARFTAAFVY